jgi:chromosome segregation ATPase
LFILLAETKEQLLRFQDEMERQENEIHNLQTKLDESYKENECIVQSKDSLTEEVEDFKEKMSEAQIIVTQLSVELMDYQEKYDSVYTLMKAVQVSITIIYNNCIML